MPADYQHIKSNTQQHQIHSFWVKSPMFGFHWHYHPEFEITYVKKGRGTRLVGDHMTSFEEGDFVFLGSNLPHTWISDDEFNQSDEQMEVAVLQFHPELIYHPLFDIPEAVKINRLLKNASRGIVFNQAGSEKARSLLIQLIEAESVQKLTTFLELLHHLGSILDHPTLASKAYAPPQNRTTEDRILKVCRFVHDHFREQIRLDDVAKLANMNPTSFCRFFKKSTGQSLSDYINDLRIGKASNLLLDQRNLTVSEVAYQCGFNSQTLFNRLFKKKKQVNPTEFRNRLRGG